MAMAETVRARAEELRTRVRTRVEEIRGGSSSSSGGILGNPGVLKSPLATEIREKGVMATARARIEKIRGGGSILGSPEGAKRGTIEETSKTPSPPTAVAKRGAL
jgi:hypothetical protein